MKRSTRQALIVLALTGLAWPPIGCGDDANVVARQVDDYVSNVSSGNGGAQGTLVEGAPPAPTGGPAATVIVDSADLVPGGRLLATVSADVAFGTILVVVEGVGDYFEVALAEPVLEAPVVINLSARVPEGEFAFLVAVVAGGLVGPYTRVSVQIAPAPGDRAFALACAAGNANQEVYALDPETGSATPIGPLGEIANWSHQLVIDPTGTRLHAIGYADVAGSQVNLHTIDLASGEARQVPVDAQYLLAGTTIGGEVVAVTRGVESVSLATVFLLDTVTGAATLAGTLGPARWNGDAFGGIVARYDPIRDTVYALSQPDARDPGGLWALSLGDGGKVSVNLSGSPGSLTLGGVRASGELVVLVSGGDAEDPWSLATIDPASGVVSEPVGIPGLLSSTGRLVVDPFADVAYTLAQSFGDPDTVMHRVDLTGATASSVETRACTLAIY